MNKYFLTSKAFMMLAAFIVLMSCKEEAPIPTEEMNILFIAVEDWNATTLGCYGSEIGVTPNIDKLAQKGIRFDRAYCQGVVCNPSRASLTTGTRPDRNKVYGNPEDYDVYAPLDLPFIAGILKQKGAHTAQTGKLMHKWKHAFSVIDQFDQIEMEKPFATDSGVVVDLEPDRGPFTGIINYTNIIPEVVQTPIPERNWVWVPDPVHDSALVTMDSIEQAKLAAGEPNTWALRKPFQQYHAEMAGNDGLLPEHTEDGVCARLGVKMIEDFAKEGKQFFLNVGFYAPHTPLLAPQKYMDLFDTSKIEISTATRDKDQGVPEIAVRKGQNYDIFNGMYPQFAPTPERQKMAIAAYYACGSLVDDQVGLLLKTLEDNGLSKNTIVILWADHGFHLGEHGCWSKFTVFEQSIRVPLIVYVPGAKGNGQSCDEIVELVDMLPTMCDLWGIDQDPRFEGISFAPLLENPKQEWKKAAFSWVPRPLNGRAVRSKQFKYAEYRATTALPAEEEPIAVELYDLETDPYEQVNLAGRPAYAKIEAEHKKMLYDGWKSALPVSYTAKPE